MKIFNMNALLALSLSTVLLSCGGVSGTSGGVPCTFAGIQINPANLVIVVNASAPLPPQQFTADECVNGVAATVTTPVNWTSTGTSYVSIGPATGVATISSSITGTNNVANITAVRASDSATNTTTYTVNQ